MLGSIVGILWVSLEGYLGRAEGAFDVETEDFDAIVILAFNSLLACVEFLALVDVFAAGIAAPEKQSEH